MIEMIAVMIVCTAFYAWGWHDHKRDPDKWSG
jgi:hypothetical protein